MSKNLLLPFDFKNPFSVESCESNDCKIIFPSKMDKLPLHEKAFSFDTEQYTITSNSDSINFPKHFSEKDLYSLSANDTNLDSLILKSAENKEKNLSDTASTTQDALKPLMDSEKPLAISSLSNILAESLLFIVYNSTLYIYSEPIWEKCSDGSDFIRYLRTNFLEYDIYWQRLKKSEFTELYIKLAANPAIVFNEEISALADNYICFKDTLYNISTHTFEELQPHLFFRTFIDVKYENINEWDGMAFDGFIDSCSSNKSDVKQRLFEIIASCLFSGPFKGFHLLLGPSGTGKSLFANILADIFGTQNYCALADLNDLAGRWTMGQVIEKKLCICSELNSSKISKEAIRTLKQSVGDDPIMVERKYQNPVTGRCNARFVVASNFMLDLNSIADPAFENRLKITPFCNQIPPEEVNIMLRKELTTPSSKGYIIWLGLQTMHKWIENNFVFTDVEIPSNLLNINKLDADNVIEFINECCISSNNKTDCVSSEELFKAYLKYCTYQKVLPNISATDFSRKLSTFAPSQWEKAVLPKSYNGKQTRGYRYAKLAE